MTEKRKRLQKIEGAASPPPSPKAPLSKIKESNHCIDVMEKHFNKELAMTKKDKEDFKNCTKCWICGNDYIDNNVKVRDHCHITGKI